MAPLEDVPDADQVSRGFRAPEPIDILTQLQFPSDKTTGERSESVYWRKYAKTLLDVHARGCAREAAKNAKLVAAAKPATEKYIGAMTCTVDTIRTIRSSAGYYFEVEHEPEAGDLAHTKVAMRAPKGKTADKAMPANDRRELVQLFFRALGSLDKHTCPPTAAQSAST